MARKEAPIFSDLSRRERQIMEVVHAMGRATVAEVRDRLPEPPSATAVRTMLGILAGKGQLRVERDGVRHVYLPATSPETAQRSALRSVLGTFFGGSTRAAVAALLDLDDREMSADEVTEIRRAIARERGRT